MDNFLKIAVWKPSNTLLDNLNKLDFSNKIIGIFDDDVNNIRTRKEFYKQFQEKEITSSDFDYLLISYENFRSIKKYLNEVYGVPVEKIYTFEEYWVKDCESLIVQKYHDRWEKIKLAQINEFAGKTVVIFGGSSGIGKECAHCFLANGADVIIAGRNKEKLQKAREEYSKYGNIKFIQWDINLISQYEEKFSTLLELSNGKIDILVNSAGILDGVQKNFFEVTEKDFDGVISTNLKATYFLCQIFSKYFINNRIRGHIVNVASSLGFLPTVKPYAISKWGIVGLTKGLGMNLAEYGIIVNGIAPGEVATPILNWTEGNCPARKAQKIGRVAFTCEIAESILHLAGYTGENFVGEVIVCDGGDKSISLRL